MGILTKEWHDSDVVIGYIFDIFSKYKLVILKEQLHQVVEIFMDTDGHQL